MKLSHQVSLPLKLDEAWSLLDDPTRLAAAMPGAHLENVDGDRLEGRVNVRLGPMNLIYQGVATVQTRDVENGILLLDVSGREQRGAGTATAQIRIQLEPEGETTTALIDTDLSLTGRPAQLGAGMVQGVAQKIFSEFAEGLSARSGPDEVPRDDAGDTLDLTPPLVYLASAAAVLVLIGVVIWLMRR